jgi:ribosome-binding protein aMBF1 (putative translation factor)
MTPQRLAEILQSLGWSQRGLARTVGWNERTVRRWCSGEYAVPNDVAAWLEGIAKEAPPQKPARHPTA